ncbi:MAG: preprotein translocase subunit SecG [Actinomycetota bacterium]|nr:preprotein translocase subunit SecG [Actinomycetota bacterium]MDD5665771.1 preprotein translocase subunit SecG [Actinomycetota bacterium]
MDVLKYIMLAFFFISSVSMVVFVLLHSGKGGGMSSLFGGASMGGAAGTQIVQKNLDRMTIASAVTFVISTLILIFIYK